MPVLLALLLVVPFVAMAARESGGSGRVRPGSYAVTLIRESAPGVIHDPNLVMFPRLPLFAGLSRVGMTVWFDHWKWREADRWLTPPPPGHSSLARFTTAPLPSTSASDGHRIWTYDPAARTVTVYPYDPAGTWPASEGYLKQFTQQDTLAGILHSGFHCTTGILRGRGQIAGRAAYQIEFGRDQCRHLRGGRYANQSRLLDGRLIVWIDTATFFTLRADQYAFDGGAKLILRTEVTSIRYDLPLDPALFRLTVPPTGRSSMATDAIAGVMAYRPSLWLFVAHLRITAFVGASCIRPPPSTNRYAIDAYVSPSFMADMPGNGNVVDGQRRAYARRPYECGGHIKWPIFDGACY